MLSSPNFCYLVTFLILFYLCFQFILVPAACERDLCSFPIIMTLKDARMWLKEQERPDAPQVAPKTWRAIKLQHGGKDICQQEWRHFR